MKAVLSFYSGFFKSTENFGLEKTRKTLGGFKTNKAFFESMIIAVNQANKFFDGVDFVCDKTAWELIEPLELPFKNVRLDIAENITQKEMHFWAASKLHAYRMQDEPFCHLDNDFYIWKPLPDLFRKYDGFATVNECLGSTWYKKLIDNYEKNGSRHLLPDLETYLQHKKSTIPALNVGMVGFYNIKFKDEYVNDILNYINKHNNPKDMHVNWCVFLEQYYLGVKAKVHNLRFVTFSDIYGDAGWAETPYFTHLLSDVKQKDKSILFIETKIKELYPEYIKNIEKAVNNFNEKYN
jgi:hypothetical protein